MNSLHGIRPEIFLLVDLREFFFRFRIRGTKQKLKGSENDQLTGHYQSIFLISPGKAVKLVR